jgi:ABC-2 type transport system ATP-binding protein/lipopolysaccharide transport system ATP-binding protein
VASIVLEDVSVSFPIYGVQRSFRKAMFERAVGGLIKQDARHRRRVVVDALHRVNLRIDHGDRVGLIGHNGAGKSTLLRVLAGIYRPDSGRVVIEGRVTPLFNTSPGLDVDSTGYENIVTCGMFLGMSRAEIDGKMQEIETVSELGEYLSLPMRAYSAGMIARFGFALATALDPEILLLDEVMGTGDARFAERAQRRLDAFIGRSKILVLAAHAESMIESLCTKAALLHQGRIVFYGPAEQAIAAYRRLVRGEPVEALAPQPAAAS